MKEISERLTGVIPCGPRHTNHQGAIDNHYATGRNKPSPFKCDLLAYLNSSQFSPSSHFSVVTI